MSESKQKNIPVTVFTGFLGAGKTTILLSLLSRLDGLKVAVLKNEFGDVEVDSALIKQSSAPQKSSIAVQEMLNGCLCCVLVGQMKNALIEMRDTYQPDRILVETSGSAFPAPIAWQIRQLYNEGAGFELDAILTVIDCVNFNGYEDTSYTAQLQAKYTDLIILNKSQLVSEDHLDRVLDRVNDLNTDTPKIHYNPDVGADPALMIGLDSQLFMLEAKSEVASGDKDHHQNEIDIIQITVPISETERSPLMQSELDSFFSKLDKEEVFRVKGLVRCIPDITLKTDTTDSSSPNEKNLQENDTVSEESAYLVNYAFGRGSFSLIPSESLEAWNKYKFRFTVMGLGLKSYCKKFSSMMHLKEEHVVYYPSKRH